MTETDALAEATATYQPKTGGIHPREAAQHHAANIASVIRKAIKSAGDVEIDGIAFSQGPGMGRVSGQLQQQPAHWHVSSVNTMLDHITDAFTAMARFTARSSIDKNGTTPSPPQMPQSRSKSQPAAAGTRMLMSAATTASPRSMRS